MGRHTEEEDGREPGRRGAPLVGRARSGSAGTTGVPSDARKARALEILALLGLAAATLLFALRPALGDAGKPAHPTASVTPATAK